MPANSSRLQSRTCWKRDFPCRNEACIVARMADNAQKPINVPAVAAISGAVLLACLAAFIGWIKQGPEMFLTLAGSGLSWCF